jgi:putative membrane protein
MSISAEDRQRISEAIRAAESNTSGEIICVLAESSATATALPIFLAAIGALALPWLLVGLTAMPVYRILSLQIVAFVILTGLFCWPPVGVALMSRRTRRAVAHRVAMEQFRSRGLAGKSGGAGVLIFVSLAERYARIIVGDEMSARVPKAQWQAAVDALIAHMRDGRIADGFVAAIDLCGSELAKHYPRTDASRNELPDRIYLI